MAGSLLPMVIPDLLEHQAFPADRVHAARQEKVLRKCLLKEYKLSVVRPVLLHFDRLAYFEASCKPLPELGMSLGAFLAGPTTIPVDLLKYGSGPGCWR